MSFIFHDFIIYGKIFVESISYAVKMFAAKVL